MIAFAEGFLEYNGHHEKLFGTRYSDIVAGYIKAAETWPSIVAEITKGEWRADTVLGSRNGDDRLRVFFQPASIAGDNKVFPLAGICEEKYDNDDEERAAGDSAIQLVVGVATQPKDGEPSGMINWAEPNSLSQQISKHTQGHMKDFVTAGGSGIVMQNDTLVFSLSARNGKNQPFSMINYSTDKENNWVFPEGIFSVECLGPRITEWENGQILMIAEFFNGQSVFESRDMGKTWKNAARTLSGVWVISHSGVRWDESLRVGALIAATIGGRKVMLYIQRGNSSEASEPNALYLWVTDNSRTFHVGPLFAENAMGETLENALLYSDDALHLSRESIVGTRRGISLAHLTEELKTINSVLSTWGQLDASSSKSSTPTAGLVGFLSNAASDHKLIDDDRCVNVTAKKAAKVKNGFKFTGPESGTTWPVNGRDLINGTTL
ncbi:trans-sialidase [Trypanosoma cruzi]|nr:trans-sialidase [Trypanosoma cruzi]